VCRRADVRHRHAARPENEEAVMAVPGDWWKTFFNGVAVEMWTQAVPAERTEDEADELAKRLVLSPGASVLDVPCGAGRVALALARRGYDVTGVDWSVEFLDRARTSPGADAVRWHQGDMRDLPWRGRFDAAFCVGNSFGYLDDEGDAAFLRAVASSLKPGGRFLLETPMIIEALYHLQDRPWWQVGDIRLLVKNEYDAARARLETEYTFVEPDRITTRHGTHRVYGYAELIGRLEAAGFRVEPCPWTRDQPVAAFIGHAPA
jgi:SAM-dependent methyltransferase